MGWSAEGEPADFVMAVVGAVLLLVLYRLIMAVRAPPFAGGVLGAELEPSSRCGRARRWGWRSGESRVTNKEGPAP
jgi:Transglycosylase associated protein